MSEPSDHPAFPEFPCPKPRPSFEEVLCATWRGLERARRDPEYMRAICIKAGILDEEGNPVHHEMAGYLHPERKAESVDSAENGGSAPNRVSDQILGSQRHETQIAQYGVQLSFDFQVVGVAKR